MNNESIVIEALELLNLRVEDYALSYLVFDYDNGNVDLENEFELEEYRSTHIVEMSIINGQIKQAREQCLEFGLKYEEQLAALDG